jgi:CDP-diacylglycerol--glycerol-3-phosphate 3-phosphatidyltransferase
VTRPPPVDHLADPPGGSRLWNLPNMLTMLRLILVPVFAVTLVADPESTGLRVLAFLIFAFASFTDLVDGEIARRRGQVTTFGKVADPIADKALMGTALVGLSALGELAWWVTIVILVREIGVTLLRFWVIRHGVISASRGGKLKTLLQGLAIGLYILPLTGVWASARVWVMGAALVVTVATGLDYLRRALVLRRTSERAAMKRARRAAS